MPDQDRPPAQTPPEGPGAADPSAGSDVAVERDRRRLVAELLASLQAYDEFAAAASHDLRSPLQAVQVRVHMIGSAISKLQLEDTVRDKLNRDLDSIRKNTQTQVDLLNHLLDTARARGRKFTLVHERVDLSALVHAILQRYSSQGADPHRITIADGVSARCDRLRVEQIVSGLLENATAAAPGRPFELSLSEDGEKAILRVSDQGPSLSDEARQRAFDRPRRADAPIGDEREPRLWMVKNLAVACGGTITAEATAGTGVGPGTAEAAGATEAPGDAGGATRTTGADATGSGATFIMTLPLEPPVLVG